MNQFIGLHEVSYLHWAREGTTTRNPSLILSEGAVPSSNEDGADDVDEFSIINLKLITWLMCHVHNLCEIKIKSAQLSIATSFILE